MGENTRQLRHDLEKVTEERNALRSKLRDADKEERRLSAASCQFQLKIHDLFAMNETILVALRDCQESRDEYMRKAAAKENRNA